MALQQARQTRAARQARHCQGMVSLAMGMDKAQPRAARLPLSAAHQIKKGRALEETMTKECPIASLLRLAAAAAPPLSQIIQIRGTTLRLRPLPLQRLLQAPVSDCACTAKASSLPLSPVYSSEG